MLIVLSRKCSGMCGDSNFQTVPQCLPVQLSVCPSVCLSVCPLLYRKVLSGEENAEVEATQCKMTLLQAITVSCV